LSTDPRRLYPEGIAPSGAGRAARVLANVVAFSLPALVLTSANGMSVMQLPILLALVVLGRQGMFAFYAAHRRALWPIGLGFGGYFLVSLLRFLVFGDGLHALDGPSRMLFALSCIGFVGYLRPRIRWFWFGLCFGAIGAAVVAINESIVSGTERVAGFTHHPISFGDLAVAMGVLALCSQSEFRRGRWAPLPIIALLCGLVATVLSGSRGAWLGLLLSAVPMFSYGARVHGRRFAYAFALALALGAVAYFVPVSGIERRLGDAVVELRRYGADGAGTSSIGIRLELWKASLMMIAEHPWLGVGRDGFAAALHALVDQGRMRPSLALLYSSSHNDVLHVLATGGLLDLVFLLLMYVAPLRFFMGALKGERQGPALAGIALVVAFIGFGLTDVMFWLMIPKVFYAMMVCTLIGFCLIGDDAPDAERGARRARADCRRILLCRTDNIGDVVLTLPLAAYLKARYPGARVDFLCRAYVAPVVRHCHHIDQVIEVDAIGDARDFFASSSYDTVIFVHPNRRLAMGAWRARVEHRVGTSHRLHHWLTCNRLAHFSRAKSDSHEAELNFRLLAPLGLAARPSLAELATMYGLTAPRDARAEALFAPARWNLILHPKSNGNGREWPLAHYARLAQLLTSEPDIALWITGSAAEGEFIAQHGAALLALPNVRTLCGKFDLGGLLALIGAADGLVASGTGPLHLSAALGKPTLGLFPPCKPIDPARWGALGPRARSLCPERACARCDAACACMESITPSRVAEAVRAWRAARGERLARI
jgi:ADP-heptose:LPS heptosyltransferase/O-antigen ligase